MRDVRVRLMDIAEAIAGIDQTIAGADFSAFAGSWPMRSAVERGLEIISEASRGIPEEHKSRHPGVPWRQIAGIGNILRHEYHRGEAVIIWNITRSGTYRALRSPPFRSRSSNCWRTNPLQPIHRADPSA